MEALEVPETEVLDVTDATWYEVSQVVVTRAQVVTAARPTTSCHSGQTDRASSCVALYARLQTSDWLSEQQ